jgi:hypothetical protein
VPPGTEPLTLVTGAAGGSPPGGVLAEEATSLGVVAVVVEPTTLLKLSNNCDSRDVRGKQWLSLVMVNGRSISNCTVDLEGIPLD